MAPSPSIDYVEAIVRTTIVLRPDMIVLGGDYSLKDRKYIRPCLDVLAALKAPLGVFGVLGNHDYWHGVTETRAGTQGGGCYRAYKHGRVDHARIRSIPARGCR